MEDIVLLNNGRITIGKELTINDINTIDEYDDLIFFYSGKLSTFYIWMVDDCTSNVTQAKPELTNWRR